MPPVTTTRLIVWLERLASDYAKRATGLDSDEDPLEGWEDQEIEHLLKLAIKRLEELTKGE